MKIINLIKNKSATLLIFLVFSQTTLAEDYQKLLILGDSISAGYGISKELSWVETLQKLFVKEGEKIEIINASISGETTLGGFSRVSNLISRYSPNFILIELGGNDALRGYPVEMIKSNLVKISEIALKSDVAVVLMQIRIPPNYGLKYTSALETMYLEISETKEVHLIPFVFENISLNKEFMMPDGIHPNEKAQPLIADKVYKFLKSVLALHKQD